MKGKVGFNVVVLSLSILLVISSLTVIVTPVCASDQKVEVLIGFKNKNQVSQAVLNSGGKVDQIYSIIPAMLAKLPEKAIEALRHNPNVEYVEPNSEVYALEQTTPWGIDRVFGSESYIFDTWTSSTGAGVTVAVLDTGIAYHEDLTVVGGYNTIVESDSWLDGYGHGTHVAGTIAALDNSIGVVGVAPAVDLYAVKVLDDTGSGYVADIIEGIEWSAITMDIDIISMSLGSSSNSYSLELACNSAYYNYGSLLVASAGNDGNPPGRGDNVGYPAKYGSVIAVAATDQNDKRARFSSTGPDVEFSAPGVDILSTYPGGYAIGSGTSMACPHVSGVAALVWAADPTLTNVEVRTILQTTAQDLGLAAEHQGYGLVRADAAVDAVITPTTTEYDLTIALTGSGYTDPTAGTYSYEEGSQVSVTAYPDSGWSFDHWELDNTDVGNANPYTVTIDADHSLIAVFTETIPPPAGTVSVESIIYATTGGRNQDKHLLVTITLKDDAGTAVSGASVSIDLYLSSTIFDSVTGTSGDDGTITFQYNNAPSGTYTATVTNVSADGLTWDGSTPPNSFNK